MGGGRLCDGYIVNAAVKAHLVSRLRRTYHQCVWVFGDGPLDVLMMQEADQAIVVVGDEESRSRSMDSALEQALATAGFSFSHSSKISAPSIKLACNQASRGNHEAQDMQ